MMNKMIRLGLISGALLTSAAVIAAPLAKVPPLNKDGKEMVSATHMDFSKQVPDSSQVPYPAYPGSYFIRAINAQHPIKGQFAEIVLASNDPAAKVRAWYAKHLKGMKYVKDLNAFAPAGFKGSLPALLKISHVSLHSTTPKRLGASLFDLPKVKTKIWIDFFPK